MAERQVGLKILLDHGHFLQIVPINEADAKYIMDTWQKSEVQDFIKGHSFTEDGQPWKYAVRAGRVVGMHTFSVRTGATFDNPPVGGAIRPSFGRS